MSAGVPEMPASVERELARVLDCVKIATAAGSERRSPGELGFAYRSSNLMAGEIVVGASFALRRADPASVAATLADMRGRRHEAQPQGIKTFGSTFKNPGDARVRGLTAGMPLGQNGCSRAPGGAPPLSPPHPHLLQNTPRPPAADLVSG